ncbi:hypothetical protein E2C01_063511 [Portunus trituberculatus]|uniref:Uncharacterized protein n=1 Tax=Portunus trituberculatus TaxID=210409 RepID=A0A5B7HDV7_PORTR|nr:hypothetical protein [Portunus trituberculatus]
MRFVLISQTRELDEVSRESRVHIMFRTLALYRQILLRHQRKDESRNLKYDFNTCPLFYREYFVWGWEGQESQRDSCLTRKWNSMSHINTPTSTLFSANHLALKASRTQLSATLSLRPGKHDQ